MMYRYYLNGQLLKNEPAKWEDRATTIKRDYTIKGILRIQEGSLIFSGDGYSYLFDLRKRVGYCEEVDIVIEKSNDGNNWRLAFKGIIFMSQVELLEKQKYAVCKLQDDSYYAKINNNKSLPCTIGAGKSKNGVDITVPPITLITLFDPATALYFSALGGFGHTQSYLAIDVFKYFIAFMTDGEVDFKSTLFDVGGARYKTHLTVGRACRTYTDGCDDEAFSKNIPEENFSNFIKELDHNNNLFFIIERAGGRPVFRLEQYDYFFGSDDVIHSCENIDELKTKTDIERIYSGVKLGSSTTQDVYGLSLPAGFTELSFPGDIRMEGFKIEKYITALKCNIDKELDLSTTYIIDTNVIQDIVVNNVDTHDGDFILIDGDPAHAKAKQSNWLNPGPTPMYYNEAFRNRATCTNYLGAIPASIITYLGKSDNKFRASKLADESRNYPFGGFYPEMSDEVSPPNFDTNSNYDAPNSRFLVPASGIYSFVVHLHTKNWNYATTQIGVLTAQLERWDNTVSTQLGASPVATLAFTLGTTEPILEANLSIIANQGDYIYFASNASEAVSMVYDKRSYWECGKDIDGGSPGSPDQEFNPSDYPISQHEFKHELTEDEFEDIDSDPRGLIEFSRSGEQIRKGWIETLKFYHQKGNADFLLDSSKTLNK